MRRKSMLMGSGLFSCKSNLVRLAWIQKAQDHILETKTPEIKIDRLASSMGQSRSSFYRYFQSKDDLLELVVFYSYTAELRVLEEAALKDQGVTGVVRSLVHFWSSMETKHLELRQVFEKLARSSDAITSAMNTIATLKKRRIIALFRANGFNEIEARLRATCLAELDHHKVRECLDGTQSDLIDSTDAIADLFTKRRPNGCDERSLTSRHMASLQLSRAA